MAQNYDLTNTGQEVQQRLNQVPVTQQDLAQEILRAEGVEQTLQGNIDDEKLRAKAAEKINADDIDAIEEKIPSGASSSNKFATESEVNSLSTAIEAILLLIPSAATSLNKLADKAFVNSSISTASATFRGTYNLVTDLSLTVSATHAQIATALAGAVSDEDNNDYAFVQIPTSDATPTQIAKTERYKFNGTAWEYEYDLNNSGYTSAQWAAINSGITQALVNKLSDLPTNADLTTALGVLTSSITTINQKIPSAASQANQLVDTTAMESYIVQVLDVLTASFNVTSSDGHVTVQISQVDGKITSFALTTLDIASAASLSLVEGRVTTAEGNISTNSADIAILQDAYAALTQSELVVIAPTDTWPVANPEEQTIYRVVDRTNTPPQNYSDYMWNGTTMVLMATYDNAIDAEPTEDSHNLVESGGVFGALEPLREAVDDWRQISTSDLISLGGAYLYNVSHKLVSGDYSQAYCFPVERGKKYLLSSAVNWNSSYDAIGFRASMPVVGEAYDTSLVLSTVQVQDQVFIPSSNGYVILIYRSGKETSIKVGNGNVDSYELKMSLQETNSRIASINAEITDINGEIDDLYDVVSDYELIPTSGLTSLGGAYLYNTSHKLVGGDFSQAYCFPVERGKKYLLSSAVNWNALYDAIGFRASMPVVGEAYDTSLVLSTVQVQDQVFIPSSNGYVILIYRSGKETSIKEKNGDIPSYNLKKGVSQNSNNINIIYERLGEIYNLRNKNVAILGDSIMQFMGGSVPYENVITLKNYDDPTDTNVYQISDASIVDGIIYLTSSLVDGNVVEGSVRLDVVNSEQGYIDSRGWDYVKNKIGARNLINCAQGGGRYAEMGIVTAYPSATSGEFGEKLRSFPNQVRMLKRIVSEDSSKTPDCIVIWMGVNGTNNYTTDTLASAMSIDWNVLEDDILGYNYRTKFYGAIRYGIESLYRAFPDAVIIFVSPIMTSRGNLQISNDNPAYRGYDDLNTVANNVRSIAERYSCMFFDALHQIGIANFAYRADTEVSGNQVATGVPLGNLIPRYTNDGLHPNDAGKVVLGNYISKMLLSYYFDKK